MLTSSILQGENGHPHHHHSHHTPHKGLTPSHSSDSLNGSSKIPHRLPAKLNKELEKRKIGSRYS